MLINHLFWIRTEAWGFHMLISIQRGEPADSCLCHADSD